MAISKSEMGKFGMSVRDEVDKNYAAFTQMLPQILAQHRNKFALMRNAEVVGYYTTIEDAYVTAEKFLADQPFSVQKVTDLAADLGFFSHAVDIR